MSRLTNEEGATVKVSELSQCPNVPMLQDLNQKEGRSQQVRAHRPSRAHGISSNGSFLLREAEYLQEQGRKEKSES